LHLIPTKEPSPTKNGQSNVLSPRKADKRGPMNLNSDSDPRT
jgi:hypothetical protein